MLHRLALRVLPSLSLVVTEDQVRKHKRLVMFVPGLIAFGLYRLAKHLLPLSEPMILLAVSGMIALLTAAGAYRVGRRLSFPDMVKADGVRRVIWLLGWIGFAYGVQLSLLVLALLWLVGYDYLKHPDGPAMMAVIIACTAVARDAFEIGCVRRLEAAGRPFPTFPDGMSLRTMIATQGRQLAPWLAIGLGTGAGSAALGAIVDQGTARVLVQLACATIAAGSVTVGAYFAGQQRDGGWVRAMVSASWMKLFQFWWWPGLAFAATYLLVLAGAVLYLARAESISVVGGCAMSGLVGGVMALYGYYLGHRRQVEDRAQQTVPASMLRCPFVMGILGKSQSFSGRIGLASAGVAFGKTGPKA